MITKTGPYVVQVFRFPRASVDFARPKLIGQYSYQVERAAVGMQQQANAQGYMVKVQMLGVGRILTFNPHDR